MTIWRRCVASTPFFGARRIARTLSEEGALAGLAVGLCDLDGGCGWSGLVDIGFDRTTSRRSSNLTAASDLREKIPT